MYKIVGTCGWAPHGRSNRSLLLSVLSFYLFVFPGSLSNDPEVAQEVAVDPLMVKGSVRNKTAFEVFKLIQAAKEGAGKVRTFAACDMCVRVLGVASERCCARTSAGGLSTKQHRLYYCRESVVWPSAYAQRNPVHVARAYLPTSFCCQVSVPTFLMHGAADDIAYPSGSEEMKSLLTSSSDVELQVISHVFIHRLAGSKANRLRWLHLKTRGLLC